MEDKKEGQEGGADREDGFTNEYRNLRSLLGSVDHINAATAEGHKPDFYHLAETWWETDRHPVLDEYEIIAYTLATREFIKGRAKGGMAVYKHKDCKLPTRNLQFSKPIENAIATEIGGQPKEKGNVVIIAYYLATCSSKVNDEILRCSGEADKSFRGPRLRHIPDGRR